MKPLLTRLIVNLFVLILYSASACANNDNTSFYQNISDLVININDSVSEDISDTSIPAIINNKTLYEIRSYINKLEEESIRQVQNKQLSKCESLLISTYMESLYDSVERLVECQGKLNCKSDEVSSNLNKIVYLTDQILPLLNNC